MSEAIGLGTKPIASGANFMSKSFGDAFLDKMPPLEKELEAPDIDDKGKKRKLQREAQRRRGTKGRSGTMLGESGTLG